MSWIFGRFKCVQMQARSSDHLKKNINHWAVAIKPSAWARGEVQSLPSSFPPCISSPLCCCQSFTSHMSKPPFTLCIITSDWKMTETKNESLIWLPKEKWNTIRDNQNNIYQEQWTHAKLIGSELSSLSWSLRKQQMSKRRHYQTNHIHTTMESESSQLPFTCLDTWSGPLTQSHSVHSLCFCIVMIRV